MISFCFIVVDEDVWFLTEYHSTEDNTRSFEYLSPSWGNRRTHSFPFICESRPHIRIFVPNYKQLLIIYKEERRRFHTEKCFISFLNITRLVLLECYINFYCLWLNVSFKVWVLTVDNTDVNR